MDRDRRIAHSIARALTEQSREEPQSRLRSIVAALSAAFSFFELPLHQLSPEHFARLRREHWELTDDCYTGSFRDGEDGSREGTLHSIGDMGYSGSTFYATDDQCFLVKSVPRRSEYSFFRGDLLEPYIAYMATHPRTLLVRICDFLGTRPRYALGKVLGLAPSHHIVMDNVMQGAEAARRAGRPAWQHWDLKPTSYFYPERDVAAGMLATEATLSRLADEFDGKVELGREQADDLLASLEEDTRLLALHNAVDYSLFLVRIAADQPGAQKNPFADPPSPPSWRTGVPSQDGRYVYRTALLDFFWAKHKIQPRLMTMLVGAWNLATGQGHMSITTTPEEYRERFLRMCRDIFVVKDGASGADGAHGGEGAEAQGEAPGTA